METQSLHVYRHFNGIFNEIDNGNYYSLATHPEMQTRINDKQQGYTPLFLACLRKNFQIIDLLLQFGADPNIECKSVTPLYLCCLYAEEESVQALLEFGADPNIQCTSRKIAPLHLAALKGLLSVCQKLIKHNANVNIASPKYGTPVHIAVNKNHQNIVKYLLENGAALNIPNEDGETPLHTAARYGHVDIIKMILEQPTLNPNVKEHNEGNTALHLACLNGRETVALLLIQKFPDLVYMRNTVERQTPLFYAGDSVRKAIKNAFTSKMPGFIISLNNKAFHDIRFVVQDKLIYAHRVLLEYRCPILVQNESKEIYIYEIEHAVFLAFIQYLYTDSVTLNDKILLQKLGKCAERYDNVRLKKICIDLTTNIDVSIPPSTFKEDLSKAVNNPQYSDVIFIVEEKSFFAHKAILSQHEYFRTMFNAKLRESSQKEIPIKGMSTEVFKVVMNYCYTWEMEDIPPDFVGEVLEATDQFMIEGLRHCAEAYLCTCISKENVCGLFHLSDLYKCLFLKEECFDFLVTNFKSLGETSDFTSLSKELQEEITDYVNKRAAYIAKLQQQSKPKTKDTEFSSLL